MLKSVIIKDFFAFKGTTTIPLNPGVNLLLGINGSGKTSFINALRILSEGVAGDGLVKLLQERWGGFDQIVNFTGEEKASFAQITYIFDKEELNKINPAADFQSDVNYRITINRAGTSYALNEEVFTSTGEKYLSFINGTGQIAVTAQNGEASFQEFKGADISGLELVLRQINDPTHYLKIHTLRKAIESIAVYSDFNVGEDSKLRYPTDFTTDTRLKKSGSNLPQILNDLKLDHTFEFDQLEKTFHNVNPHFKSIEISNLYGKAFLMLKETNLRRAVSALHISDGTLRFLLLESILYNPNRGLLVAIDEPERGLHPDMIKSVADMMKHASKTTQLIAATHSPHLLNQFDLSDILVFEKTPSNTTSVHPLSESDFEDIEGDLLPGQLWLLGQIGAKRW